MYAGHLRIASLPCLYCPFRLGPCVMCPLNAAANTSLTLDSGLNMVLITQPKKLGLSFLVGLSLTPTQQPTHRCCSCSL